MLSIFLILPTLLLFLFNMIALIIVVIEKLKKQKENKLLKSKIEIQEAERKRIAEDIHDQIGPMLSAIRIKINLLKEVESMQELHADVKELNGHIDILLKDIRQAVRDLSPENLQQKGLIRTIEEYQGIAERSSIAFQFRHEGMDGPMKHNSQTTIYRIVSELISNSISHSHCTLIKLIMKMYDRKTIILYTDNGFGSEIQRQHSGMGLKNIESRVKSFSGKLFCKTDFREGAFYQISFDNNALLV